MTLTTASRDGSLERDEPCQLPWALVDEFSSSMPDSYRVLFDPRTIRQHCSIVSRRGIQIAHVEVWRVLPDRSAAICVVAEDRPDLLPAVAAALVSHGLDVITALAFSRTNRTIGRTEAVEILWVRWVHAADKPSLGEAEARSIGAVVTAMLEGRISIEDIASCRANQDLHHEAATCVRFDEVDEDGRAVLIVEAPDRTGILLTIALQVFLHGARVARSLVRTVGQRAYNRFQIAELNGEPLTVERRERIRSAVQASLAARPDDARTA
jgi:[protein-PII] uridylyltransferase